MENNKSLEKDSKHFHYTTLCYSPESVSSIGSTYGTRIGEFDKQSSKDRTA